MDENNHHHFVDVHFPGVVVVLVAVDLELPPKFPIQPDLAVTMSLLHTTFFKLNVSDLAILLLRKLLNFVWRNNYTLNKSVSLLVQNDLWFKISSMIVLMLVFHATFFFNWHSPIGTSKKGLEICKFLIKIMALTNYFFVSISFF